MRGLPLRVVAGAAYKMVADEPGILLRGYGMRRAIFVGLAISLVAGVAVRPAYALTDADVVKAIEKAQKYRMARQGVVGAWPEAKSTGAMMPCGMSEVALFTPVYTGIHANQEAVAKGMSALLTRNLDASSALSMRLMAYAYIQRRFSGIEFKRARGSSAWVSPTPTSWSCTTAVDSSAPSAFSLYDILFSTTGYDAYDCRGYRAPDARGAGRQH